MGLFAKVDSSELVVLSMLAHRPAYGYLLSKEAAVRSDGRLRLTPGVLYPLLKGLEADGLIASHWEEVKADGADAGDAGRRRKWYRLTVQGRQRLKQAVEGHRAYFEMIRGFLPSGKAGQEGAS